MAKKDEKKYEEFDPQYIVDETGKKSMVILRMDVFENLIEDLHDLAIVAERKDDERIPYEIFREELKKDGKL